MPEQVNQKISLLIKDKFPSDRDLQAVMNTVGQSCIEKKSQTEASLRQFVQDRVETSSGGR